MKKIIKGIAGIVIDFWNLVQLPVEGRIEYIKRDAGTAQF